MLQNMLYIDSTMSVVCVFLFIVLFYSGFFPFIVPSLLPFIFYATLLLLFMFLLHPCHTSCMGSPFPIVYGKWYLVFRSFGMILFRLKTAFSQLYDSNNNYWESDDTKTLADTNADTFSNHMDIFY